MKISQLKSLIKESIKEVLKENYRGPIAIQKKIQQYIKDGSKGNLERYSLNETLLNVDSDDFLFIDEVGEEIGDNGPYIYADVEKNWKHFKVKWNKLPENVVTIENVNNSRNVGYGANKKEILDEEEIEIESHYIEEFEEAVEKGDIDSIWSLSSKIVDNFYL